MVDLSIGTPCDPPPPAVIEALAHSDTERGYPPHSGSPPCATRRRRGSNGASASRCRRRRSRPASAPRSSSARCRSGSGCARPIATPCSIRPSRTHLRDGGDLGRLPRRCPSTCTPQTAASISTAISADDAARALCLWVNSPSNPPGALDDLGAAAAWGRRQRRAGVQRRVLLRVHVGRPGPLDPRTRHSTAWSPCTRCRSGRTSPGSASGSTPVTPRW